jgi:lipopolysaccharide biosynthesis regulator YciM
MAIAITIVVVVAAGAALWFLGRRRAGASRSKVEETPYHLGLDSMIAGDLDSAMKHFTRAVRDDPRNVDAYIKLGNILRQRGQVRQAIQIHRELLVKRKLPTGTRNEITMALARDLAAAGRWREVLEQLATLPKSERAASDVLAMTRDAYESAGDLERALQTHKELLKSGVRSGEPSTGVYRAHLASIALARGDSRTAKAEFQAALKEDGSSGLAYLHLGDIASREGDAERAVAYWMRLVSERPDCAHLAFDRLEKAYYDMGDYGRMMSIYEEIVAAAPGNVKALSGLARMLERKGSVDEAVRLAREAVKHEGPAFEGHRQLIEILMRHDRKAEAAEAALSLLARLKQEGEGRKCEKCGAPLGESGWRCSSCRTWLKREC